MTLRYPCALVSAAALAISTLGVGGPALAQTAPSTTHKPSTQHKQTTRHTTRRTTTRKKSFVQRHPVATSVAAGVAAHHIAKKTGQRRTATGQKRNLAQRHPVATGIAAAAATHHAIKKHSTKPAKPATHH